MGQLQRKYRMTFEYRPARKGDLTPGREHFSRDGKPGPDEPRHEKEGAAMASTTHERRKESFQARHGATRAEAEAAIGKVDPSLELQRRAREKVDRHGGRLSYREAARQVAEEDPELLRHWANLDRVG